MRPFIESELVIATHNQGKLDEISALLAPFGVKISSAKDHNLDEPDETGITFVENARIKAHAAAQPTGLPALADDSGIEIDALGGAPGVYTADWAETPNGRDFIKAMRDTHEKLMAANVAPPHTARFCSTLVLAWPDGQDAVFEGRLEGAVIWPMRGHNGHGYDPIFQPTGYDMTFAEMESDLKNKISHRAKAFEKLVRAFASS
jgi:XTP/dITP diphosphohydrolase